MSIDIFILTALLFKHDFVQDLTIPIRLNLLEYVHSTRKPLLEW